MADETFARKKFLKREDIRTMEKDINRLKEDEAKMERERITSLKTGEIKGRLDKKNLKKKKEDSKKRGGRQWKRKGLSSNWNEEDCQKKKED